MKVSHRMQQHNILQLTVVQRSYSFIPSHISQHYPMSFPLLRSLSLSLVLSLCPTLSLSLSLCSLSPSHSRSLLLLFIPCTYFSSHVARIFKMLFCVHDNFVHAKIMDFLYRRVHSFFKRRRNFTVTVHVQYSQHFFPISCRLPLFFPFWYSFSGISLSRYFRNGALCCCR